MYLESLSSFLRIQEGERVMFPDPDPGRSWSQGEKLEFHSEDLLCSRHMFAVLGSMIQR